MSGKGIFSRSREGSADMSWQDTQFWKTREIKTPLQHIVSNIVPNPVSGCWVWGKSLSDGYGNFRMGHKTHRAHQVSYKLFVGDVPCGLELDHKCRNRACCNPAHLEPVTRRTNLLRSSLTNTFLNAIKTHCPQGHEYTVENTYGRPSKSERQCRTCMKAQKAKGRLREAALRSR